MWGGEKGEKAYITVYMIFRDKWEGWGYISYKENYVTSGHISQSVWK